MRDIFVISDLHLGHRNILKFEHKGEPLRNFKDLDEMHETIIRNWQRTVKPTDKIYVLGDVSFRIEMMGIFEWLSGHKRLVLGNHDLFDHQVYAKYFEKIHGVRQLNGVWMTHVPMHEDSVNGERVICNIHGHLHAHKLKHPKYFNASVECIDYTPISIEEVRDEIKRRT